jgi:hypothetical protein
MGVRPQIGGQYGGFYRELWKVGTSNCRRGKSRSIGVGLMKLSKDKSTRTEVSDINYCYGYVSYRIRIAGQCSV